VRLKKMELKDVSKDLQDVLGDNLTCIAVYGLDHTQIVAVVNELGFTVLTAIQEAIKKLEKKGVYPLMLTKEELSDGADVFPLEFLNIQTTRDVVYGTDVFADLVFDKKHVRRKLEYEFRSKLLLLRQGFLEVGDDKKRLSELVSSAAPTLAPVCYGMLYLKDVKPPSNVEELFKMIAKEYEADVDVLSILNRADTSKLSLGELRNHVQELMHFLAEFGEVFDEMVLEKDSGQEKSG